MRAEALQMYLGFFRLLSGELFSLGSQYIIL